MDGVLFILNLAGRTIADLERELAARQERIDELEALLALATEAQSFDPSST